MDFGAVAPGSKQQYEFTYVGTQKIMGAKSSCGCTSSVTAGNKVSGVWTIGQDFSNQKQDLTPQSQNITVTLSDGTSKVLHIAAQVNRNYKVQK